MFKDYIPETVLTSEEAYDYFHSAGIHYSAVMKDGVFISAVRGFFAERLERIDSEINIVDVRVISSVSPSYSRDAKLDNLNFQAKNRILVVKAIDSVDSISEEFGDKYKENGFVEVVKINSFYKKDFPVRCWVNTKDKSTVLIIPNLSHSQEHYLCVAIPIFFPWYFDPSGGLSDNEMELLLSLKETTPERFFRILEKILANIDIRGEFIKRKLRDIETGYFKIELERERSAYDHCTRRINEYNTAIADFIKQRNDVNIRIKGLMVSMEECENSGELAEFFLNNKNIYLYGSTNSIVDFGVVGVLDTFNEDAAEEYISRHGGYFYSGVTNKKLHEKMLRALFIDKTIKLHISASFLFNMAGGVEGNRGHDAHQFVRNTMANPHIKYYNCLGQNRQAVSSLLQRGDRIGALMQTIRAVSSINMEDATVMPLFMKSISPEADRDYGNCFELANGERVTRSQVYKMFLEEEQQEEKQNEQTN